MPRTAPLVVLLALLAVSLALDFDILMPKMQTPTGFSKMRTSQSSALYQVELASPYLSGAPFVLTLQGTRQQIGYDYAALLSTETNDAYTAFLTSVFSSAEDQALISMFLDYCWDSFLSKYTPQYFLDELAGMDDYVATNPLPAGITRPSLISKRFYTLANMPADAVNIISMLEQDEEQGLPDWLKDVINDVIKLLEKIVFSCDAYGVWGSRTENSLLFSSRNLDFNSDTGMNKWKLVTFFTVTDDNGSPTPGGTYATLGFAYGPGALAGMSSAGITVSEMNLDNSMVTFSGVPFPLRLRMVLEQATNLQTAMQVWNSTNNTNSFNFLIASAPDALAGRDAALALETIMDYTGVFPANSSVEAAATYYCANATVCHKWTNLTGHVRIGFPLPEAVWRSNHGLNPRVMETQEPLFLNTIQRYNISHDLFVNFDNAQIPINETYAAAIVATLGIKGESYYTCDQSFQGDNIMSISYGPGPRGGSNKFGKFSIAWEDGAGASWLPAACASYVEFDMDAWQPSS